MCAFAQYRSCSVARRQRGIECRTARFFLRFVFINRQSRRHRLRKSVKQSFVLKVTLIHLPNHSLPYITKSTNSLFFFKLTITSPCFCLATCLPVRIVCKDNANESNESLLSNCRVQLVLCKESTFAASRQPHTVQILQRIGQ